MSVANRNICLADLEWLLLIDKMNAAALAEKVGIRETVPQSTIVD